MSCAPYPVAVRLGNVTLSANNMVARGMNLSLGEPPQAMAFLPLWPLNNTVIYGTDGHCLAGSPGPGAWTDAGCATFRGGAYDALGSQTSAAADAAAYPDDRGSDPVVGDPATGGARYPQFTRVADALRLNANVSLAGFPLGVALSDWGEQAYTPMMGLGLGTNSTLLGRLRAAGLVASRSYSFFWGLAGGGGSGATTAGSRHLDGSVVFGGYDRAKVAGPRYTQPLTAAEPECPSQMVVTIADIVLNFANGTDASIFPNSSAAAVSACLTPGLSTLLRLPLEPYVDNLLALTDTNIFAFQRSLGLYYWNLRYPSVSSILQPYDGDLTIRLQSGLVVRIANDQLVPAHVAVNQTTGRLVANATGPDLLIDSLQDTESAKLAQLGWQFFSAAYLHVNQDTRQFSLWAANPTADSDLVAVDDTGADVTTFCAAASATSSSSSLPAAPPTASHPASSSASLGAVAGGAVAGVAVLAALVGLLVWWLLRRRRQRQQILLHPAPPSQPAALLPESKASSACETELDGHAFVPELPSSPRPYPWSPRGRMRFELPG